MKLIIVLGLALSLLAATLTKSDTYDEYIPDTDGNDSLKVSLEFEKP